MAEEKKQEHAEQGREFKFSWKRMLNYQSVVRQLPFFLFLTLLAVIYIYNGHYANRTERAISKTSVEVKELQYMYKSVKSKVMYKTKHSELIKNITNTGLVETEESPVILAVNDSLQN